MDRLYKSSIFGSLCVLPSFLCGRFSRLIDWNNSLCSSFIWNLKFPFDGLYTPHPHVFKNSSMKKRLVIDYDINFSPLFGVIFDFFERQLNLEGVTHRLISPPTFILILHLFFWSLLTVIFYCISLSSCSLFFFSDFIFSFSNYLNSLSIFFSLYIGIIYK